MAAGTFRLPVRIDWGGPGSPGVNVWHFRCDDAFATGLGSAFAAAVDAVHTFYSDLVGGFATGATVTCDQAIRQEDQSSLSVDFPKLSAAAGAYDGAPPVLAAVVSWKTSIAARRGRGRTFVGPLQFSAMDHDGTPTANLLTGMTSAAQALVDASTGANGWAIGIYGQQNQAPKGTTSAERAALPHVIRDVTGFAIHDKWAILTSRRG